VVGRREAEESSVALRFLGAGAKHQVMMDIKAACDKLSEDATPPDLKAG